MKKRLYYSIFFIFIIFISRHWLFEKTVTFKPLSEQPKYATSDSSFRQYLNSENPKNEIKAIIDDAIELTSDALIFASQNTSNDPNISFHDKRAHCVGYASFFATACNFLIEKNGMEKQWEAQHVRGEIYFLGINLHQFSDSPFFRDHDFNVVKNKRSGEKIIIDVSVWDVLWIKKNGN